MHPLYSIPNFLTSALIITLGVFVVLKRPSEKINWLFALLSWSVAHWLLGYALLYCTRDPAKALAFSRFAYIGVVFIPTFFLHFMTEFLQLRRNVMLFIGYAVSFLFLYIIRLDIFMKGVYLYFWGYYPHAGTIYWTWLVYFYAGFAICDFEFTKAYFAAKRTSAASVRTKQLKYVLWANCVASFSVMDYLPKYGWEIYPCAYLVAFGWLALMAYAIVKFRLMDVRLVIRKTLIYSCVSALLTTIYILVVTLLTHLSSGMIGQSSWISIAAAGMVVTLIFLPLFQKVQALTDRFFFRFRIDREAKLMQLSTEIIQQQENTEHLTQSLCQVLEDALHPKSLGLYLETQGSGDFLEVSGRSPASWSKALPANNFWSGHFRNDSQPVLREPSPDDEFQNVYAAVPLVSRGDVLGFFLLGEKRSEELYTNEDLILLRIIANQATVAYERPKLLREVSSGFVHEIKMPLSKISLPAELTYLEIEQVLKGKQSSEELLPRIQRRMKYIMDQAFLAGHRVEALQQLSSDKQLKREPVHIFEVIKKSVETLRDSLSQAHVTVKTDISENTPDVLGDPKQLEIVFGNLIKNAAEAMMDLPEGHSRTLLIQSRNEGSHLRIQIKDTGPGISPEDNERIFQSHYSTKGSRGSGMGLFLSRQIIHSHGGLISLAPSDPVGTCFEIELPVKT